jgi:hypothetical protein
MNATINNQVIEAELIASGDALAPSTLTARELWALETLDTTLRGYADFAGRYPHAKLVRVDSMRLLPEATPGRYYLRYSSDTGMAEFWGHVSRQARFDLKRGILSIAPVPNAPQLISGNRAAV